MTFEFEEVERVNFLRMVKTKKTQKDKTIPRFDAMRIHKHPDDDESKYAGKTIRKYLSPPVKAEAKLLNKVSEGSMDLNNNALLVIVRVEDSVIWLAMST